MSKINKSGPQRPDLDENISIFADQLLEAFGADACDVVERQIEATSDEQALATWIAIWEILCSAKARRA